MIKSGSLSPTGRYIECVCGHMFPNSLYHDLVSELRVGIVDALEDEQDVECPHCHRNYRVKLEVEIEINTSGSVTLTSGNILDKNGEWFDSSLLQNYLIGDHVPLEDGEYVFGDKLYIVENETLEHIFSAIVDENQLSLQFEEEGVVAA
jgi:hypothetical protein